MKFGVATLVTDQGIRPDVLGREVEQRGFDALFLAEHTHMPVEVKSPPGGQLDRNYYRTLDPFVALTAVAMATDHLWLGTGITLLSQRDPLITAKEIASLDVLSNGRTIIGIGVGWSSRPYGGNKPLRPQPEAKPPAFLPRHQALHRRRERPDDPWSGKADSKPVSPGSW